MIHLTSSRSSWFIILAVLGSALVYIWTVSPSNDFVHRIFPRPSRSLGFHLVLPTTGTNSQACRLLFSGAATGYSDPVLVGWDGRGRWNGSESHLFKLSETLGYLEALEPEQDDDLVLVLDAFDIWLQLPPQVMIERYYQAIQNGNQHLEKRGIFGHHSSSGGFVHNTILFGADKLCWPKNKEVLNCDSAPVNPLSYDVFGPNTDAQDDTLRPRFLNSGTIMGPIKDVRLLLIATLAMVEMIWDDSFGYKDSDQHYFGIVWGQQEAARARLQRGEGDMEEDGGSREFHVMMDYKSDAFQVNNKYGQYVTWMAFNHSMIGHTGETFNPGRLDRLELSADVLSSRGPFSSVEALPPASERSLLAETTWKDVMLGTNTITGQVFPLYHMTGDKIYRDLWWPRLWFHPYGETLLTAARMWHLDHVDTSGRRVLAEVDGIKYLSVGGNAGHSAGDGSARNRSNTKGGAWNDLGDYMTWDALCGKHEKEVFGPWT